MEKWCSGCREMKPVEAFSQDKNRCDGLQGRCKDCGAAYRAANSQKERTYRAANAERITARKAARYAADPKKVRARNAAYSAANPEIVRAAASRRRARKRQADYDPNVTLLDVIALFGAGCYICGVKTDPSAPPRTRFKAELEHVVPLSRGGSHTLANLRCACHPCNQVKGVRLTADQVREMFA